MERWISIGAYLLAFGVCLGAFGAHGLKGSLSPDKMDVWEKAVFYHLIHALGILFVAIFGSMQLLELRHAKLICSIQSIGVLLFSGSLYLLILLNMPWLGAITPLGGTAFIVGWVLLGLWVAKG